MQRQGITLIQLQEMGIVEIKLGILSIGDVEEGALPLRINLESQGLGESAELECLRNPRHIYIVEIEQVETPSQMMTWFSPAITPCR